jgi:hypothetical protein
MLLGEECADQAGDRGAVGAPLCQGGCLHVGDQGAVDDVGAAADLLVEPLERRISSRSASDNAQSER